MAAGVTDRLWDVSDIVQVLEDWEAQRVAEPSFEAEANRIGGGYFVRVMLPTGEREAIYGFATKADAIRWIRCEAVVSVRKGKNDCRLISLFVQSLLSSPLYEDRGAVPSRSLMRERASVPFPTETIRICRQTV